MPDSNLLCIRSLNVTRGDRPVLQDVNLDLAGGVITVVMGPNGAGKSMLLKIIHGLEQADSGSVFWKGLALNREIRHRHSMVFQRPVMLRRTVIENMKFVLAGHSSEGTESIAKLLDLVNLGDRLEQPARRLSGGEQQRLALARALLTRPEVLLLDEPSASLDPASAITIEHVIRDQAKRGTEVILITHDVAQANRLAGQVVFMHKGQVLENTPAEEFFEQAQTADARRYLAGEILV